MLKIKMKILLPSILLFITGTMPAQDFHKDDIVGHWYNEEKDGKVEIYEENGRYYGKLVWLKNPVDNETGMPRLDKHNPDNIFKKRPALGIILMIDFEYEGEGLWEDGQIYDPKDGSTYSCYMELESMNKLKVRGYIGISLLGRTTYWSRTTL